MDIESDADKASELPKTYISFEHDSGQTLVDEGKYAPPTILPFEEHESNDIRFEMDGIECTFDGDLGGHAVYHRTDAPGSCYTMPWSNVAKLYLEGIIELNTADCQSD